MNNKGAACRYIPCWIYHAGGRTLCSAPNRIAFAQT